MLPETLIITILILPIRIHIIQQLRPTLRFQNLRNILIRARLIAIRLIRAIAIIRPEPMDGPGIVGSRGGVGVPELSLEEKTAGRVEAA